MTDQQHDMRHMEFIGCVRQMDVDTLTRKESTYQGSWKRAGGRSAWFMARRNMDRLLQLMAPPTTTLDRPLETVESWSHEIENGTNDVSNDVVRGERADTIRWMLASIRSEDIFAKIAEAPGGEDGTVLACVRDLRCYLTLVEAEMMSRGAVERPKDMLPSGKNPDGSDYLIEDALDDRRFLAQVAAHIGMTVEQATKWWNEQQYAPEVRRMRLKADHGIYHGIRTNTPQPEQTVYWATPLESRLPSVRGLTSGAFVGPAEDGLHSILRITGGVKIIGPLISELSLVPPPSSLLPPDLGNGDPAVVLVPKEGSADGGGQHATVDWPWFATSGEILRAYSDKLRLAETFYQTIGTQGDARLLPIVESKDMMRELATKRIYEYVPVDKWVLRMEMVPEHVRDQYPRLQREMNAMEHDTSPHEYRFMYRHDEAAQKYTLLPKWTAWGREA